MRWRRAPPTSSTPRGRFTIAGTDRGIGLGELAAKQPDKRIFIENVNTVDGIAWPNGAHVGEVEIDPDTGLVELKRYTTVDDVGRPLHRPIVFGQIQGGCAQGIGQALLEENVYDRETGQLITGSFMDYAMPRADDLPDLQQPARRQVPAKTNPLGAKGVGESGAVGLDADGDERDHGCAVAARRAQHPDAGDAAARLAGHPGGPQAERGKAMKQRIFGWISTLIGIVLALAAIEVDGHRLALSRGRPLHARPTSCSSARRTPTCATSTKGTTCRYVDTLYPHPYLAFVHHGNPPCGLPNVNNIGLLNTDFPTVKRDRPLHRAGDRRLGRLAARRRTWPPPAPRFLEEELNKHYVSPNGKPFLVLNGGDGAWKEPQSFILFSMYATLGRRRDRARRLQRALLVLALHRGAAGAAAQQLHRRQSVRRRREFRRRRDRLGDGPARRLAGADADPRPQPRRLHDRARHRGGGQGQGRLQGRQEQEDDAEQHLRPARATSRATARRCSQTQLALYQKYERGDRGGGQGQQRQDRLLPPAGAELGQDADRRGEARGRRTWPTRSSTAASSTA